MKILHAFAGAAHGGAETFATELIIALAKKGVDQTVLTRPYGDRIRRFGEYGIECKTFDFGRATTLFRGKGLIKDLIKENAVQLFQTWMSRGASAAPSLNIPTLGWMGGYYDPKRFRNCDHIITCTEDIRSFVVQKGWAPSRVHYINTFALLEESATLTKAEFDVPEDATVLLCLSRLHKKKGIDVLLEALAKLDSSFYLLIAGEGELRGELESQSKRLGIEGRVRFLGWRDDRKALLDLSDICILPSRYEPFGTVIVEAWQTKTPVVAAKAKGPLNHINDKVDGFLCEIDDVEDLRENILEAWSDTGKREAVKSAGYERFNDVYNENAVAEKFQSLYARILAEG